MDLGDGGGGGGTGVGSDSLDSLMIISMIGSGSVG